MRRREREREGTMQGLLVFCCLVFVLWLYSYLFGEAAFDVGLSDIKAHN